MEKHELAQLANHPLLSREEERELGKKALGGCKESQKKLVDHNIRLVIHTAKRFVTPRLELGDAISIGILGLIEAAKRYDPDRGTKFATYATWWIRETLLEAYWDQRSGVIHIPNNVQWLESKLSRGKEITEGEKETVRLAEQARATGACVYSLSPGVDPKAPEEEEHPLSDLIKLAMDNIQYLEPDDQFILKGRCGLPPFPRPMFLRELAHIEGVSKERIRQKEQRAIERLRALILENPKSSS